MDGATKRQKMDQLVHDAYEALAPGDDARSRVFGSLHEASARQSREQIAQRSRVWRVALPLAACLVVVAVVARIGIAPMFDQAGELASPAATRDDNAVSEESAPESDAPSSDAMSDEAAAEASPQARVTLGDGTVFLVGDALANEPAWSDLEEATLLVPGDGKRSCVVADRAFVRYEGEDTWYELVEIVGN